MNPIAKVYAIAKDEDTLQRMYSIMQEELSSVRKNGHYSCNASGMEDWVKLDLKEFTTSKYLELDDGYDRWNKMLEKCGDEFGESAVVFVVYNYPASEGYYEYASTVPYADTIYSWGYDRDEVLEEFKEGIFEEYDQGKKLYRWFAIEAGILQADSTDLIDSDETTLEPPLKWSVGRKEPYAKSVDNVGKKVFFPSTIGKTVVTGIADKFDIKGNGRKTIEEIVIPESYHYIGKEAFFGCSKLKKVTLPSTLTSIGESAFGYSPRLESITIPGSLNTIASFAFSNCKSLKELIIEDGIERIESCAFLDCVKLTDVVIPNSVKSIGTGAFEGCSNIKNLTMPADAEIGGAAFRGCKKLADRSGMVIMQNKLLDYIGTEDTVVIPQGIQVISSSAFDSNKIVKSITIPDSVTEIGPSAFKWCSSLQQITIPKGVKKIYWYTFCNCQSLRSVDIPDTVTEIGENAFVGCYMLKTIDLPESVQSVGAHAFSDQYFSVSNITIVIRNPDLVMHRTCLEGCKNYTIYAPEGSPASKFSPSRTKPLQEYDSKKK